jgi:hypothetical protein
LSGIRLLISIFHSEKGKDLPVIESLNDTPKLHLPGDVGLQLLSRSGGGNAHLPGVVGNLGCRCWCRHVAEMLAGLIEGRKEKLTVVVINRIKR